MVCAEPRGGKGSAREERGLRSSQGSLSAEPGECNLQMQPRHGITSVRVPGTSQTYAWLPDPPVTATRSPPAIPASPPHTHAHTHTHPAPPPNTSFPALVRAWLGERSPRLSAWPLQSLSHSPLFFRCRPLTPVASDLYGVHCLSPLDRQLLRTDLDLMLTAYSPH